MLGRATEKEVMHNMTYPQRNVRETETSGTSVQPEVHICRPTNTMRDNSVVEDKPGVKFLCLSSCIFWKGLFHAFQGRAVMRHAVIQDTSIPLTDVPLNCLPYDLFCQCNVSVPPPLVDSIVI